jgi:tetratricopeptide (TPR) repeat protein
MLPDAVERLAHHTYEGQIWPKAMTYNMQVGRQAQREYANDIAVTAYRRALKAGEKLGRETNDEQVLAHEALGELMTLLGEYERALEHLASARIWTEVPPLSPEKARYLADLYRKTAEVHERRSDYDQALEWLGRGQDTLPEEEAEIEAARLYILQAGVHQRQGRYEECEEQCRKALDIAAQIETLEGQQEAAHAYLNLGGCYLRRGDLRQAAHFSRQSAELYQQTDDLAGQSKAFNNLGLAHNGQGDWSQASEAFQQALSLNREIGAIQEQGFVTNNLGNIHLYRGEWSQAEKLFAESNAIWKQLGAAFPDAVTMSNLGQVHIYQENWVEARACLEHSQAAFREIGSEDWLPELERRWGQYYLGSGALDEALAHTRRSVELAITKESRLEEGMSCRVLAQVHQARGERGRAADALRQSLRILNELNSEYEAAKTGVVLARLGLEHAPAGAALRADALAQLNQSIATFERLGAQADLAQARALAQQSKNP